MRKSLILSYLLLGLSVANAQSVNDDWTQNYPHVQYISASSIEALNANTDSVQPVVDSTNQKYLSPSSVLGLEGPLGAFGPLGMLGPIGSNTPFNPAYWISHFGPSMNTWMSLIHAPLNNINGPLGENGPYTESAYYQDSIFEENNFAVQTRAFGLWSILGPIAQMGAVGALGPLGPIGAHGYKMNKNGQYVSDGGEVVRTVNGLYDDNSRRAFPLYEYYNARFAQSMSDNDTSFMVAGKLTKNAVDAYPIHNDQDQIVTILVVPVNYYDQFSVSIYDQMGNLVAKSDSTKFINFIQLSLPQQTDYIIDVKGLSKHFVNGGYYLYVTGSRDYLNQWNISGDHIKDYS